MGLMFLLIGLIPAVTTTALAFALLYGTRGAAEGDADPACALAPDRQVLVRLVREASAGLGTSESRLHALHYRVNP